MIVEHNQSTYNGGQYDNAYKFNGKELDDATQMYYYGARYYDPRISIFVSLDPLVEQTFEPYSYVGNNPIMFTDPTGMSAEGIIINYSNGQSQEYNYEENRDYDAIKDDFLKSSLQALDKLYSSDALNIDLNGDGIKTNLFDSLLGDDYDIYVVQATGKGHGFNNHTNEVIFSESYGAVINKSGASNEELEQTAKTGKVTKNTGINSPTAQLGHELVHGYNSNTDRKGFLTRRYDYSTSNRDDFSRPHYRNAEEKRTTILSNQINTALGEPTRYDHRGLPIRTESPTSNKPSR